MNKPPIDDNMTTRIIPGLMNEYRIVSLPYWAWYWLDDFMQQHKVSYQGIYNTFGGNGDLVVTLQQIAELHHEYAMREVYNLANDNELDDVDYIAQIHKLRHKKESIGLNLPKIYKLFGFMSCATTLEAVWERRHYDDNNKIN